MYRHVPALSIASSPTDGQLHDRPGLAIVSGLDLMPAPHRQSAYVAPARATARSNRACDRLSQNKFSASTFPCTSSSTGVGYGQRLASRSGPRSCTIRSARTNGITSLCARKENDGFSIFSGRHFEVREAEERQPFSL